MYVVMQNDYAWCWTKKKTDIPGSARTLAGSAKICFNQSHNPSISHTPRPTCLCPLTHPYSITPLSSRVWRLQSFQYSHNKHISPRLLIITLSGPRPAQGEGETSGNFWSEYQHSRSIGMRSKWSRSLPFPRAPMCAKKRQKRWRGCCAVAYSL